MAGCFFVGRRKYGTRWLSCNCVSDIIIFVPMFKKGAVIDSKNFEHNCKYFQINKDYWVYILYNMQCVGNVSTPDSV